LPSRTEQQIAFNLPFALKANPEVEYRGKFLLFHGLSDSPFVWQDIAQKIAQRGFDVRAVLLPGHGSHPGQMLEIDYQDWLNVARTHYLGWSGDKEKIYLGGFSMGALLATSLALEFDNAAGLLIVSPAYQSSLDHLLGWAWLYSKFRPWMFGGLITEDNPFKYNSISINSGTQYYNLTRHVKQQWRNKRLDIPLLMLLSENDSVVNVGYSHSIFKQKFTSTDKQLLWYRNLSADTQFIAGSAETVRQSYFPNLRILNQSHMSLLISPENTLLGEEGKLLICNGNEYPIYSACMRSPEHWYGAQHSVSPDGVAIARTTYNPDFPYVLERFEQIFLP
jgi:esterase/lipase